MKEADYVNACNLSRLRAAEYALSQCVGLDDEIRDKLIDVRHRISSLVALQAAKIEMAYD